MFPANQDIEIPLNKYLCKIIEESSITTTIWSPPE